MDKQTNKQRERQTANKVNKQVDTDRAVKQTGTPAVKTIKPDRAKKQIINILTDKTNKCINKQKAD